MDGRNRRIARKQRSLQLHSALFIPDKRKQVEVVFAGRQVRHIHEHADIAAL